MYTSVYLEIRVFVQKAEVFLARMILEAFWIGEQLVFEYTCQY